MLRPVLLSCYFRAKKEVDGQYDRLARVLAYTASIYCPEWDVRIEAITHEPTRLAASGNPSHDWNTTKLEWWIAQLDALTDGTPVLFMDADMTIVRPIDSIWDQEFDLAYTVRGNGTSPFIPFNGGVLALRLSPAVRAAMRRYRDENARMVGDRAHHLFWRRKYAGINQAAFGLMLEQGGFEGLTLITLPCQEWNCCDWPGYAANTRIVHYKSGLRRATFGWGAVPASLKGLVKDWHALEAKALKQEQAS